MREYSGAAPGKRRLEARERVAKAKEDEAEGLRKGVKRLEAELEEAREAREGEGDREEEWEEKERGEWGGVKAARRGIRWMDRLMDGGDGAGSWCHRRRRGGWRSGGSS